LCNKIEDEELKIERYSFYINENPLRHSAVEGLLVMSFCLSKFLGLPNADGMKADTALFLKNSTT